MSIGRLSYRRKQSETDQCQNNQPRTTRHGLVISNWSATVLMVLFEVGGIQAVKLEVTLLDFVTA